MPTPEKQHLQGRSGTPFRRDWAAYRSPLGPAERQRRRTGWGGLEASVESGQSWGVQAGGAESQRQPIVAGKVVWEVSQGRGHLSVNSPLWFLPLGLCTCYFLPPGIFCITHHPLRAATSVYSFLALSSNASSSREPCQPSPRWGSGASSGSHGPLCSPTPWRPCWPGCWVQLGIVNHCLGHLWELAQLCMSGLRDLSTQRCVSPTTHTSLHPQVSGYC